MTSQEFIDEIRNVILETFTGSNAKVKVSFVGEYHGWESGIRVAIELKSDEICQDFNEWLPVENLSKKTAKVIGEGVSIVTNNQIQPVKNDTRGIFYPDEYNFID